MILYAFHCYFQCFFYRFLEETNFRTWNKLIATVVEKIENKKFEKAKNALIHKIVKNLAE